MARAARPLLPGLRPLLFRRLPPCRPNPRPQPRRRTRVALPERAKPRRPPLRAGAPLRCGQLPVLSHVTEKSSPLLSRPEVVASVTPPSETRLIWVGLALPSALPFALAPVKSTVPKFDSGSTPLLYGASAMTSAEPSCAVVELWFVVSDQPAVLSVSVRVKLPEPLSVTEAVNESPGVTVSLKFTGFAGYISYHDEYEAWPPEQSASVPVCSTELVPSPSMPTQKLE